MAVADRGAFDPRPNATPVGCDDQHPAVTGQDAPGFPHHRPKLLAVLGRMDDQKAVDGEVGEREFGLVGERNEARLAAWPWHHALLGRCQ